MVPARRLLNLLPAPGVIGLLCLCAAVHLGRSQLDPTEDNALLELLAFVPARFGSEWQPHGETWLAVVGIVSHMLLHSDASHLLVNAMWLLAVGALVARRMPGATFLVYTALCGAGGALMFMALQPDAEAGVVGASGAISGVMAAACRLVFAADGPHGRQLLWLEPLAAPRLSVADTFAHPLAVLAMTVWMALNVLMAVTGQAIAWEAHIGGFLMGLLTFGMFDRGRVLARGVGMQPS